MSGVPAERFVDDGGVHGEGGDATELLEGHGVDAVGETLAHSGRGKETDVAGFEIFAVFVRGDEFVEFETDVVIGDGPGS